MTSFFTIPLSSTKTTRNKMLKGGMKESINLSAIMIDGVSVLRFASKIVIVIAIIAQTLDNLPE